VIVEKPSWLHSRNREWARLAEFADSDRLGAGLAIVYGRRRQGKTALLEALGAAVDGFYWQAIEQSAAQNLESFSLAWSAWLGESSGRIFGSWAEAINAMFSGPPERSAVVLLDEFGYLLTAAPEVASLIQAKLTPTATRAGRTRLVLCGSAFSQLRDLLSGTAPLRGRATLELVVGPFDYRVSADYWELSDNIDAAFRVHAVVGGTPGYRVLAGGTPNRGNVDRWMADRILDPASPLFREGRILVAEEPSFSDRAMYWGVLGAIAEGKRHRQEIAVALGRPEPSVGFPLRVLVDGGWVEQVADPFHSVRSTYRLTEPIVRFHRLVIEPEEGRLRRGQAEAVVQDTRAIVARQIYGPHLEWIAAEWAMSFADTSTLGGRPRSVTSGTLRFGGESHQVDLVAKQPGPTGRDLVHAIGEVKAGSTRVGREELDRLDAIADRLGNHRGPDLKRLIVARSGFTAELERIASGRGDVELVDLRRLYEGS
jgi:uncharacterized protein